jgi:hypothetical protein
LIVSFFRRYGWLIKTKMLKIETSSQTWPSEHCLIKLLVKLMDPRWTSHHRLPWQLNGHQRTYIFACWCCILCPQLTSAVYHNIKRAAIIFHCLPKWQSGRYAFQELLITGDIKLLLGASLDLSCYGMTRLNTLFFWSSQTLASCYSILALFLV